MSDYRLQLFSPHEVYNAPDGSASRWDDFNTRFLAQGDSWFSIGAMPPWATSNLLQQLQFGFEASAVNCAYPGRELARMVDWKQDTGFSRLLAGNFAFKWNGILLPQFGDVVALRDRGTNSGVPIFCHAYAYPMPRDAPASELFHMGPWLYPAVVAYGIPRSDWLAVATELIDRLAALLRRIVDELNQPRDRQIYLVGTQRALIPARPDTSGPSNDWENEIHPTSAGYRKLAALWRPVIEAHVG